jgi:uncharacterized membrane protein YhhN
MWLRIWPTGLALIAGALHILAEYRGPRRRVYVLKPLTTTLILALALLAPEPQGVLYRAAVVVGLAFSLAGDVFLMLPSDRFTAGLASFLLAHLAYILAFTSDGQFQPNWLLGAGLIVYALIIYLILVPDLGRERFAVLIYTVVIAFMTWAAWGRWQVARSTPAMLAGLGAVIFLASDTSLALNRFQTKRRWGQLVTLSSYYLAQLLIAWSV